MSNSAQRRGGSGLALPGHMQQQQLPPELLAALEQQQPSREEQARAAGIQLAMAFNEQRTPENRLKDIQGMISDANHIATYLTGPSGQDD